MWGVSRVSVKNSLYHSIETFGRGTFPCCFSENFSNRSNIFMHKSGRVTRFSTDFLCLTGPKNFVEEPSCASEISWYRNSLWRRAEAGITIFCRNVLSYNIETFGRGTFLRCISENSRYRKTLCIRVEYHCFLSKNFCLTGPKNFLGEPSCASEILWYRNSVWRRTGAGITIFCQNFLSYSIETFRRGTFLCCVSGNFRYRTILWIRGRWVSRFFVEIVLCHSTEIIL